ncbi:hypothetical protein [Chondrinema litorale]|uniref:hypothetical protein n=1 Tax=Chondrinema litorale TaxID=2994555 RepID=UPI0025437CF9|nr:hypothetical protein [Chondrinema litorale]UZR99469.1 hypothetical protein OQ292_36990 [Chondrinema litorale]
MKRKNLVKIHLLATAIAVIIILTFFTSSVFAELNGEETFIKTVKTSIFYALPLLLIAMPTLGISGNKLAGKSTNQEVLQKQKRMKLIVFNGIVLISLASFLYYRVSFKEIDVVFFYVQMAEFAFGIGNLVLIGLNIKSGMKLSGRLKKQAQVKA